MKIKVIKCSSPNYWYYDKVGDIFDVVLNPNILDNVWVYWQPEKHRLFQAQDVEIIKEKKMKVVEKFSKEFTFEYPCLKVTNMPKDNSRLVVLFTGRRTGTVLKADSIYSIYFSIGQFDDQWIEEEFEPYTGTLEISNGDM